jgi:hypothetical protein
MLSLLIRTTRKETPDLRLPGQICFMGREYQVRQPQAQVEHGGFVDFINLEAAPLVKGLHFG